MHSFEFIRPADVDGAIATANRAAAGAAGADFRFVAGGTTLIDLMKLNVEKPGDGGLRIGATVRNSALANDATVKRDYSVLSQAILSGASAQLRNMATTAGNILQRTRC